MTKPFNYYLNWLGFIKDCVVKKKININYDSESIMLSNSNDLRIIKSISENDKLGLYDLYPSCNYKNNIFTNFKNINDENKNGLLFLLLYLIIPIILVSLIVIYIKMKRNARISSFSE